MNPPKPSAEHQEIDLLRAIDRKLGDLVHIAADNGFLLKSIHDAITVQSAIAAAQLEILGEIRDDLAPEPSTVSAAIAFGGSMTPGTLAVGSTLQASFVGLLADGTVNTATTVSTAPTWSSSDASVATIDANGLVTGVGQGWRILQAWFRRDDGLLP